MGSTSPKSIFFLSLVIFSFTLAACSSKPQRRSAEPIPQPVQEVVDTPASAPEPLVHTRSLSYPVPWSYEGEDGPEYWGQLHESYALCSTGRSQSPVNLVWKRPIEGGEIAINYKSSRLRIFNNGHTIRLEVDPGSFALIRGQNYELKHLSFRTSSEHSISGNHLPMEAQFFHQNDEGQVAVIALILIEGQHNPFIETLWQQMPRSTGQEFTLPDVYLNPKSLIPSIHTYYHYTGSLTTPPCSEDVNWNVFNTPVEVSREQIMTFRQLFPHNSRPIQSLNNRKTINY